MAHFANAKGGLPYHKREEERRWKEHLDKHKKSVKGVKSTIVNNNDFDKHIHIRLKLKRLQIQEDRMATIGYENRRLLENITRIEKQTNPDYWNGKYADGKDGHLKAQEESSSSEEEESSGNEIDSDQESHEDIAERQEAKRIKREQNAKERLRRKEEKEAKRQASLEHYNRMGMLEELRMDKVLEENKKLERNLNKIMKGLNKTNGDNDLEERVKAIREAQEALRKENQIVEDDPGKKTSPRSNASADFDDERKKENKRLHKKLLDIQKGKGRKKDGDPEGLSRWWVTSPRGKDKNEYEHERQKFIEEQKLAKQQKKIQRDQEEKELMKKNQEKSKKERDNVPEGYRKKRRKKKISVDEQDTSELAEDEELPDTSIVSKDPYGEEEESGAQKKKAAANKTKKSPNKKGGASSKAGRDGKNTKKRK